MMRKLIITGCLAGASFFVACNNSTESVSEKQEDPKELEMYEESELALLMRKMYEDNLEIGKMLKNDSLPASFPQDFLHIHDAIASKGMLEDRTTFDGFAASYVENMKKMEQAATAAEARIAYNDLVMTCASCHQVYCQGPLAKIKRMKLPLDE